MWWVTKRVTDCEGERVAAAAAGGGGDGGSADRGGGALLILKLDRGDVVAHGEDAAANGLGGVLRCVFQVRALRRVSSELHLASHPLEPQDHVHVDAKQQEVAAHKHAGDLGALNKGDRVQERELDEGWDEEAVDPLEGEVHRRPDQAEVVAEHEGGGRGGAPQCAAAWAVLCHRVEAAEHDEVDQHPEHGRGEGHLDAGKEDVEAVEDGKDDDEADGDDEVQVEKVAAGVVDAGDDGGAEGAGAGGAAKGAKKAAVAAEVATAAAAASVVVVVGAAASGAATLSLGTSPRL